MSLFKSHKDEPGASEPYPKLGAVPDRPEPTESAEDRRKIAEGLVADRSRVQYTDEALRGGTEPSAPPPPPPITEATAAATTPSPTEAPQGAPDESTGATEALPEEVESRPGFFHRLFSFKKEGEESRSSAMSAEPRPVPSVAAASAQASPDAAAPSAAEMPQAGAVESTGATEIGTDQAEERPGFFRRLFGSKGNEESNAASAEPASSIPSAEETPQAGPTESTGATEVGSDRTEKERPGFFRRLFRWQENEQNDAANSEPEPAISTPTAAPSAH